MNKMTQFAKNPCAHPRHVGLCSRGQLGGNSTPVTSSSRHPGGAAEMPSSTCSLGALNQYLGTSDTS